MDFTQLDLSESDWPKLTDAQHTIEYLVGRVRIQQEAEWPPLTTDRERDLFDNRMERIRDGIERWVSQVPAEFQGATFPNLRDNQHPERLRRWLDTPKIQTLWIAGGVGNGKTFCAYAIAGDALVRSYGKDSRFNCPVVMNTVDMLDQLKPSRDDHEKIWNRVRGTDLLVLDDLGAARPTDWAIERLYALADHRSSARKHTLITLNRSFPELKDLWGGPTVDRFILNSGVIDFRGSSLRQPITNW
ncbi:ATP-binding protein [Kineosporia succinea]|nr:ATP-binding protein [Kineosporia succinea]